MDTDEEDLERRETSESEGETSPEPENPTYTEQELTTLVQYVKDLTVLSHLDESDWNENCYKLIREFFQCVSHTIMVIFFNKNKLTVSLNLLNCKEVELMYFLRSPLQIYSPNNFLSTILCGSVNKDKATSMFKFLLYMYSPTALNSNDWPKIIKNDLYMNLHHLLMVLNERICKSINRTVLYVPKERLPELNKFRLLHRDNFGSIEKKDIDIPTQEFHTKELIERLEKIVRRWTKQIHEALAIVSIRKNIKNIMDEQKHWTYVYDNLNYLNHQLSNQSEIKTIIKLLRNINSSSIESFPILIAKVQAALVESSSNVIYLNILSEYCRNLCISDEIESHITKILLLILFIWMESPFYNIKNNIENLCQALSTQIISQCEQCIDLELVFKGPTDYGIHVLENCIFTCRMYKKVYDNFIKNIASCINPYKMWDLDEKIIFNNVTAFIQRCYDIIEICNARIIFERCTKTGTFGSTRGVEYEKCCQQIENLFYDNLSNIIIIKGNILNIEDTTCNDAIHKFRIAMIQIENMIKNLINYVFQNIKNIDEGIEAIYVFERFTHRTCLKDLIHTKWIQVWRIFVKEIEMCYTPTMKEIDTYYPLVKSFSRYSNIQNTKQHHLKMQYTKMINAFYWLTDCVNPRYFLEQYKVIIDKLEDDYFFNEISN
ncbi:hypothetical protein KPH14_001863 [Odynerus spinipes]|uniref:Dynein heavy chain tail domain-containing protein n=1 Tax=Odynerus spinipes TaxID=1348599 RepID=A0AAD9RZX3_9HYME|nr:hypothetical protein KPH14_001863 [Odynerus spinipes]